VNFVADAFRKKNHIMNFVADAFRKKIHIVEAFFSRINPLSVYMKSNYFQTIVKYI
jgi:hypothetical protein